MPPVTALLAGGHRLGVALWAHAPHPSCPDPSPILEPRKARRWAQAGRKPTGEDRMARDYELGIIVNPEVGDEQARAIVERVTQFVGSGGGQVVRVNAWGRRHFAPTRSSTTAMACFSF